MCDEQVETASLCFGFQFILFFERLVLPRKDIVSVASELEKRRLEESVAAVHKRVEKHFAHPGEGEVRVAYPSVLEFAASTGGEGLECMFSFSCHDFGIRVLFPQDLKIVAKLWQAIGSHMVSVVKRLEEAASTSYHISLESGPAAVAAAFAHHVS